MQNHAPLTALPRALIDAGYDSPKYRTLYEAALSARFPATQAQSGRWTFRHDDLPTIASTLRLPRSARR